MADTGAWFVELDRFADVPLFEDGRDQPPAGHRHRTDGVRELGGTVDWVGDLDELRSSRPPTE